MVIKILKPCAILISSLLLNASLVCLHSAYAMDTVESMTTLENQDEARMISAAKEMNLDTPFGKKLKEHIQKLQVQPAYPAYLQETLLPEITAANLIHNDDTIPTATDSDGNSHKVIYVKVNGRDGSETLKKIEFNKSNKTVLAEMMAALGRHRETSTDPQGWLKDREILGAEFIEPQRFETAPLIVTENGEHVKTAEYDDVMVTFNKTSFKKPRWAAVAVDNLSIVDRAEIVKVMHDVKCFPDASKIELKPLASERRNLKIFFVPEFTVEAAIFIHKIFGDMAVIAAEIFRDWVNVGGGYTTGARMQEECNLHASPEAALALIAVEESKKALEGDRSPKTIKHEDKDILLFGKQQVDIYPKGLIKRDGTDRILNKEEQFPVTWIFSAAFDGRVDSHTYNMPAAENDCQEALLSKRMGVMKAAAYSQQHEQDPEKVKVFITGASGTGVFKNPKDKVAAALKQSVEAYGEYFDVIVFAGMDEKFQPEILKMVQEELKGTRLQADVLTDVRVMQ